MKIVFDEKDMIDFVKWYDEQNEDNLKRTFKEDFDLWLSLQNTSSNNKYTAPQATPKSCSICSKDEPCGYEKAIAGTE